MTHYLRRRFRERKMVSLRFRAWGRPQRPFNPPRFTLQRSINPLRHRRRLRSLRPIPDRRRWLTVKVTKVRRIFYTQMFFKHRLVHQQSSGQVSPRYRQRTWSAVKLVRLVLPRLERFTRRYPQRRKQLYRKRWRPAVRGRRRYVWWRPRPLGRRYPRRLTVVFNRWRLTGVWIQVLKLFQGWFRRHRWLNLRVRIKFLPRVSHNGQRRKKQRRI